jgi:hypothetical protein
LAPAHSALQAFPSLRSGNPFRRRRGGSSRQITDLRYNSMPARRMSAARQIFVSRLKILPASSGPGGSIRWTAVPGERYRVEYCDDLADPVWTKVTQRAATGLVETVVDPNSESGTVRCYRIVWEP